jgi:hypothetical protein
LKGRNLVFFYALLNALDMSEKGFAVSVVMEERISPSHERDYT